jgi:hypothetical protein
MYAQSIKRNFKQYATAKPCVLRNRSIEALAELAHGLVDGEAAVA